MAILDPPQRRGRKQTTPARDTQRVPASSLGTVRIVSHRALPGAGIRWNRCNEIMSQAITRTLLFAG